MPEHIETEEPNIYEAPPQTHEMMEHLKNTGTTELPDVSLSSGITKDAQEVFHNVREIHKHDTESGMHKEAGIQLPLTTKSESEKADLANRLLAAGRAGKIEPFDLTNSIEEISNN